MEFGAQMIRCHGERLEREILQSETFAGSAALGRDPVEKTEWVEFWAIVSEPRIDPLQVDASKLFPNSIEIETDTDLDDTRPIRWKGRKYAITNAQPDEMLGSDLYRYLCDAEALGA